MNTVVDASVLVKRLLAEPDSQAWRDWFDAQGSTRFVGPALLFSETGRVLQRTMPTAKVAKLRVLHERLMAGVTLLPPHARVWESVKGLTFYDAHYVQLARDLDARLATSDEAMRKAARKLGVDVVEA